MTKEELRKFVKMKFKELGFQSRKSYFYKIFDDDYLVGFHLQGSTYGKAYQFVCGIIYLPDEYKFPVCGRYDLQWYFEFPFNIGEKLDLSQYPDRIPGPRRFIRFFNYEEYSLEQLEELFEANYEYFMIPLYDKEYGLNIFRSDWRHMGRLAPQNVAKICERANLDKKDVFNFLGLSLSE